MWQHWVNVVLGLAVIVVAFIGLTGASLMYTLIVGGVLVAIVGLWGALGNTDTSSMTTRQAYQ